MNTAILLGIFALVLVYYHFYYKKKKDSHKQPTLPPAPPRPASSSSTASFVSMASPTSRGTPQVATDFKSPIPSGYQIFTETLSVAGVTYRKATAIQFIRASGQELRLAREPDNPHDSNAIKVIGVAGKEQYFIGYLPRELAEQIVATQLFDSIQARLKRIYHGHDDYIDIQLQILGRRSEKKNFDDFLLNNQLADSEQKEYFRFFGLAMTKGMTAGQAQQIIQEHKRSSTAAEQSEWQGYVFILGEFDDEDFRETNNLKKVHKKVLLEVLNQLKHEGYLYDELSDDIDLVVDKVLENRPDLFRA